MKGPFSVRVTTAENASAVTALLAASYTRLLAEDYEPDVLAKEALDTLKGHFKERLYEPIRRSTKLAEAPSHRQTIFEYAPDSHGAKDYQRLVEASPDGSVRVWELWFPVNFKRGESRRFELHRPKNSKVSPRFPAVTFRLT